MKNQNILTLPEDLITSADTYIQHKKESGQLNDFVTPHSVVICYQQSTFDHLLKQYPDLQKSKFTNLYAAEDGGVGVLGGWGMGAPALAAKVEQLGALGVKRFIGVGTAGALMHKFKIGDYIIASKALGEDGVAHLYLDGPNFAEASLNLNAKWQEYASDMYFHEAASWSFSSLFRERFSDVIRVTEKGCGVVDMETATLFAIAKERGFEAIALFVVSDVVSLEPWVPHLKDPVILAKVWQVADKAVQFCQTPIEQ